jgi:DNA-binding IclR family transcriptional regulator
VPLHCTASGKLFLAHLQADARDTLLAELPTPKMTSNTLVSARALRAELTQIAERGYAIDREEFIPGLIALAVPVRETAGAAAGPVRAAIAVHAPSARLSLAQAVARLPALQKAAAQMARLL